MEEIKTNVPVRILNKFFLIMEMLGSDVIKLDKEEILAKAKKKTGLSNFGHEKFLTAIDKLNECTLQANISPFGKFLGKFMVKTIAMNRLRIEDYIEKNPHVTEIRIDHPLFVLGLPRSGTTMLQYVLCMGHHYRGLYFYEIMTPYPLNDDPVIDRKKRIRRVAPLIRLLKFGSPNIDTAHDFDVDSLEEDWLLITNSLGSANMDLGTGVYEWNEWLMSQDRTWVFEEFRRLLQIQVSLSPAKQFVLKSANHIWSIDLLMKTFPKACFVWIHRNPFVSIASFSSLQGMVRRLFTDSFDPKEVGMTVLKRFKQGIRDAFEVRKKYGDDLFLDLNYHQIVQDIPNTVRRIREKFNMPHGETEDHLIREWLKRPRKDFGKHMYDAEKWGLSKEIVLEEFKDYIERYQIMV